MAFIKPFPVIIGLFRPRCQVAKLPVNMANLVPGRPGKNMNGTKIQTNKEWMTSIQHTHIEDIRIEMYLI